MRKIAILITCYNRKEKTIKCIESLHRTYLECDCRLEIVVYLTDDGCTDGTADAIRALTLVFRVVILQGSGSLYWNGGMLNSWNAAMLDGGYDGYLWLNDDTVVMRDFWDDLLYTDSFCRNKYCKGGIYVGSTRDGRTGVFSYGGFVYTNKWTLSDSFIYPNEETVQECQCAHGNITFISNDVVEKMGLLYDGYVHGGGDHDYTYRAYKNGFPILVMPHYCGECENDHIGIKNKAKRMEDMSLNERYSFIHSPFGFNIHNTILFQRRCFPHRLIPVIIMAYARVFFPGPCRWLYAKLRS